MRSTPLRHPRLLRWLHWIVAAALLPQWLLGRVADAAGDRETALRAVHAHAALGAVLALLVLLRLVARLRAARRPDDGSRLRRLAAGTVHGALYAVLLLLPASGYVIHTWMGEPLDVFGIASIPRLFTPPAHDETWRAIAWYVHNGCAWAVVGLVALHVAAACRHELVQRGWIRQRMG